MKPSPQPEDEIALAKQALKDGKVKTAARHVGRALAADPKRDEWLALLDRIIAAAPDPLQLIPAGKDLPPSDAAVRAYVLADQGQLAEAVNQLLQVVMAKPEIPYLSWAVGWLDRPEAARALDMSPVSNFLGWFLQRFPGLVIQDEESKAFLKRLLPFVKKIDATQATDEMFLFAYAALLRKLGRLDEALAVALQAHANQPSYHTAVALAMAHEAKGDREQWYNIYQEALRFNPDDVPARLDLGDKFWGQGRLDEAERWYKEVLQRDPQHPWARPSYFALRYEMNNDDGWKAKLLEYAKAHADNDRARRLVAKVAPYLAALPEPADATVNMMRQMAELFRANPPEAGSTVSLTLNWLEAPSNRVAFDLQLRTMDIDFNIDYVVTGLQTPDPRKPRVAVEYLLWRYKGNNPVPAVREPSTPVAALMTELAKQEYDLKAWSQKAAEMGKKLGPASVEDLLGVLVHPPSPPAGTPSWTWVQRVQVAAALALAHVDAGWKNSKRRKVLFDLANGPLDWSVGAAILALTTIALEEKETLPEITDLFIGLMNGMPKQGYVPYAHALVCCFLRFPNINEKERQTLRDWRRDLERED